MGLGECSQWKITESRLKMECAAPHLRMEGIFDILVPGNWVLPDDQLWLAIVKPPLVGTTRIGDDTTRPQALALANSLFSPNGDGQYPIAINAPTKTAIVLFPEFAFGSGDFTHLDALIQAQPRPLMVFAGFGAVHGGNLRNIIQAGRVQCGWQNGLRGIDATKHYNAAWCWIHDPRQHGPNAHRCYILLKNWPEQRNERIGIPDIANGTETVRLVADDCTIFPVICSDILSTTPNSVHERIAANIRSNMDRNKVLIPVLMLDGKPSNPAWRSRLANMIQAAPLKVAVVTCNHVSVSPLSSETDDRLRCLSGALVSVQQFSPDHREVPYPVRPVTLDGIAGYVLRSTAPGIAAGEFIWREVGLENRFVWLPNLRSTLESGTLIHAIDAPVQIEMQRWCDRVRRPPWLSANSPGDDYIKAGFTRMRTALKPVGLANTIWPEAFTGRGLDTGFAFHVDEAGTIAHVLDALDEVYLIVSSVMQTSDFHFEPLTNRGHFHRPTMADRAGRDIIIWSSPDKLSDFQYQKLQEAALDGRYQRALLVIARGAGGASPGFTRVMPVATTDYSNGPPPEDDDITEPAPAPIFWMPSGELHALLAREDWLQIPQDQRSNSIGLAIEALLNRIAA